MSGDLAALEEATKHRQHRRLQMRLRAARMMAEGLTCVEVMQRLSISRSMYYQLVAEFKKKTE